MGCEKLPAKDVRAKSIVCWREKRYQRTQQELGTIADRFTIHALTVGTADVLYTLQDPLQPVTD
jgi:hypothetical protein